MRKALLFILLIPILSIGQNTITICDGDSALIFGNWETSAGVYTNGSQNTTLVINPLPIITPNFILNGNAQIQPGNVFQLTSANNGQSGSVWSSPATAWLTNESLSRRPRWYRPFRSSE